MNDLQQTSKFNMISWTHNHYLQCCIQVQQGKSLGALYVWAEDAFSRDFSASTPSHSGKSFSSLFSPNK